MGSVSSFLVSTLGIGYVLLLEVSKIDYQYSLLQNPAKTYLVMDESVLLWYIPFEDNVSHHNTVIFNEFLTDLFSLVSVPEREMPK